MMINIGYIFDEGFAVPAVVSIYSLLYNNAHLDEINIYILDDGITQTTKDRFVSMVRQFNRSLYFVKTDEVKELLSNKTKFNWNGSYSTYIRLMLNTLLPEVKNRIIMIDADTIIDGKIDPLIDMDLGGNICATAFEAIPLAYHKYSGLGNNMLINGGIIVVDLELWDKYCVEKKVINYLENIRAKNMLTDEDVISEVLKGQISIIPLNYNFLTQFRIFSTNFYYRFLGWEKLNRHNAFYSLKEITEANEKPVIYHCIDTNTNRPWHKDNIHPFTELFDLYLSKTPWSNYEKITRRHPKAITRISYYLRRRLPPGLSVFLYAVTFKLYYGLGAKKYYKTQ